MRQLTDRPWLEVAGVATLLALLLVLARCAAPTSAGNAAAPPTPLPSASAAPSAGMSPTAPLDRSATTAIGAAIDDLYLKGRQADAEAQLKGIDVACADRCSAGVKARVWMYIGIIWGNESTQGARARSAFRYALSLDPTVGLDEALAAPATQHAFELEQAARGTEPTPSARPERSGAPPAVTARPGSPRRPGD